MITRSTRSERFENSLSFLRPLVIARSRRQACQGMSYPQCVAFLGDLCVSTRDKGFFVCLMHPLEGWLSIGEKEGWRRRRPAFPTHAMKKCLTYKIIPSWVGFRTILSVCGCALEDDLAHEHQHNR